MNSGNDRGRIWRIAPKDFKPPKRAMPTTLKGPQLVQLLAHPNGWHRDTAARLIFEQQDQSLVPALEKLAANSAAPLGQIHALGLARLGALEADHLLSVLEKGTAPARVQAMQLAEQFAKDPRVVRAVFTRVDNPSHEVLYQLALTASVFPASEERALLWSRRWGRRKAIAGSKPR